MVICINESNEILWLTPNDAIKQTYPYKTDDNVIWVEGSVHLPTMPNDGNRYTYIFDRESKSASLKFIGEKQESERKILSATRDVVKQVLNDNLLNTDLSLMLTEMMEMLGNDNLMAADLLMMVLDNQSQLELKLNYLIEELVNKN